MTREPSIRDVVLAVVAALSESRELLNRLDGVAGDGDLGVTAGRAAEALTELAPTLAESTAAEALKAVGMTLARRAPSTGGTLLAFACLAAGKVEPGVDPDVRRAVADHLAAARDEVARRGKVTPGDRTMLDALDPAVVAFGIAVDGDRDLGSCLAAAAAAADAGATATTGMEPTTGRAGWLADRARGHEDAGARLVAIVFAAISRAVPAAADPRD
jgi:phosphoenolpyruvate---glycerone phosphotransferase subunit DhaL